MKFYVNYFGCRSNQAEIQEWIIELENSGYQLVNSIQEADFGIVNTCSVTERAERDVLKFLNRVYKNTHKQWIITGCTVSKEKDHLFNRYKNYIFLPNTEKNSLISSIMELFPVRDNIIYHSAFRSRIFMKIQDGCNLRCSFCIVPFLRGKSTSLSTAEIIRKAKYYVSLGYREIILTGINLSAYGYDLFPRENLITLIKELDEIKNLEFIRLSSLDPRYVRYPFIKELSYLKKIAQSFHFSIQSGSNMILRKMNRAMKSMEMKKVLNNFSKFFPDANFGADIIVGFPGEGEKEFQETVEFVKQNFLNYLHIFPFSPREGTKAQFMEKIPLNIMKRRVKELREINSNLRLNYREKFLNKTVEGILIEENENYSLVITSNFLSVRIPPLKGYKKRKIKIKIKSIINENICEGEVSPL
jgi:threonylcarbamoyladenosine tRNA methylthiotransferase MtaB